MYAKFGEIKICTKCLDHMYVWYIIFWNFIIAKYEKINHPYVAIKFFHWMQANKVWPDLQTLVCLSSSVAQMKDPLWVKSIHEFITMKCWIREDVVIGNRVNDMYAKLGITDFAWKVYGRLSHKDVISWNTVITDYAQNGLVADDAVEVYNWMREKMRFWKKLFSRLAKDYLNFVNLSLI